MDPRQELEIRLKQWAQMPSKRPALQARIEHLEDMINSSDIYYGDEDEFVEDELATPVVPSTRLKGKTGEIRMLVGSSPRRSDMPDIRMLVGSSPRSSPSETRSSQKALPPSSQSPPRDHMSSSDSRSPRSRHEPSEAPFCGPEGGAGENTYPVNTSGRFHSALGRAHFAPNPDGVKLCAYRNAVEKGWIQWSHVPEPFRSQIPRR
jgi:hypothetical protein